MSKKQRTHKNSNTSSFNAEKCLKTLKNSKTIQQSVSLIKDTAVGLGSLIVTAVSELTDAIKDLNKNKN